LFSCNKELGEDVRRIFVQLTSLGKVTKLHKLLQSPFTLHQGLIDKIDREIENKNSGKATKIIIKVNAVVEEKLIQTLYKASQAGVEIKLIVRGVCCLRPGVKNISENIEVHSIIGRFLEHTRVYAFKNGGDWEVYAASADLMNRNMFRRVETCFPIENKKLRDRVLSDLNCYLKDNAQTWFLQSDGSYLQVQHKDDEERYSVQEELLKSFQ
jgi:polyphosphate kinase